MAGLVPLSIIYSALQAEGLRLVGFTNFDALDQDRIRLEEWQNQKKFAGMEYMNRPSSLLSDPKNLMADGISIISVAMDYGAGSRRPEAHQGFGKVARYAWGNDYHIVFRQALQRVATQFEKFGSIKAFTDAVPLLERAIAHRGSQKSFIGKNTLFIQPGTGSFFFLGEILCGFPIEDDRELPLKSTQAGCGSCTQCGSACPTGALDTYSLDASRCISYLTIEHRKMFSDEQTAMLGDWIFGCDICQEVCPFNYVTIKRKAPAHTLLGGHLRIKEGLINLEDVLRVKSEHQFRKIFDGSPLLRTKRKGLIRNALAVAYNQEFLPDTQLLQELLQDPDLFVAQCAALFVVMSEKKYSNVARLRNQAADILAFATNI